MDNLESFLGTLVPDNRVTLCEVGFQDGRLHGTVEAALEPALRAFALERGVASEIRFLEPTLKKVAASRVSLLLKPQSDAETVSEAVYGEPVKVYDRRAGFCRVATARDDYLGWVPADAIAPSLPEPTYRFNALRGHIFAGPTVASPRLFELSYGAELKLADEKDGWSRVLFGRQTGFVRSPSLQPLEAKPATAEAIVRFARRFLETPYVWGGVTAWGCDCSGLVQTVYGAHGITLPRDSDQQQECGEKLSLEEAQAADLLFFPGHVAIALGKRRFIHANAHHMRVTIDSFDAGDYGALLQRRLTRVSRLKNILRREE